MVLTISTALIMLNHSLSVSSSVLRLSTQLGELSDLISVTNQNQKNPSLSDLNIRKKVSHHFGFLRKRERYYIKTSIEVSQWGGSSLHSPEEIIFSLYSNNKITPFNLKMVKPKKNTQIFMFQLRLKSAYGELQPGSGDHVNTEHRGSRHPGNIYIKGMEYQASIDICIPYMGSIRLQSLQSLHSTQFKLMWVGGMLAITVNGRLMTLS